MDTRPRKLPKSHLSAEDEKSFLNAIATQAKNLGDSQNRETPLGKLYDEIDEWGTSTRDSSHDASDVSDKKLGLSEDPSKTSQNFLHKTNIIKKFPVQYDKIEVTTHVFQELVDKLKKQYKPNQKNTNDGLLEFLKAIKAILDQALKLKNLGHFIRSLLEQAKINIIHLITKVKRTANTLQVIPFEITDETMLSDASHKKIPWKNIKKDEHPEFKKAYFCKSNIPAACFEGLKSTSSQKQTLYCVTSTPLSILKAEGIHMHSSKGHLLYTTDKNVAEAIVKKHRDNFRDSVALPIGKWLEKYPLHHPIGQWRKKKPWKLGEPQSGWFTRSPEEYIRTIETRYLAQAQPRLTTTPKATIELKKELSPTQPSTSAESNAVLPATLNTIPTAEIKRKDSSLENVPSFTFFAKKSESSAENTFPQPFIDKLILFINELSDDKDRAKLWISLKFNDNLSDIMDSLNDYLNNHKNENDNVKLQTFLKENIKYNEFIGMRPK